MNTQDRTLWELKAAVQPKLECDKVGVTSLELGRGEAVSFKYHQGNKTTFSVTVSSHCHQIQDRATFIMRAFVGVFGLESKRSFTFEVGIAHPLRWSANKQRVRPLQSAPAREILNVESIPKPLKLENLDFAPGELGELAPGQNVLNVKLTPKPPRLEDLDFALLKHIADYTKTFNMPKKNRILTALNFLYDAIAATTSVQSYLIFNGALDYLTSGVGRAGRTEESHKKAVDELTRAGVLDNPEYYERKLHDFHHGHYCVMKSNKATHEQLDEIKAFFKEFLVKYLMYLKVGTTS